MRLAGTWKQYSMEAIIQLTRIAFQSGDFRNLRCPYHAKVIKMFEIVRRITVRIAQHLTVKRSGPCYSIPDLSASIWRISRASRRVGFLSSLACPSSQLQMTESTA